MAILRKEFGKLLRRLREKRGFSQEDFAGHAGLNWRFYGQLERGESNPTLDTIDILAKGLGLEMTELIRLLDRERKASKKS